MVIFGTQRQLAKLQERELSRKNWPTVSPLKNGCTVKPETPRSGGL
jgi:hypothetical protein